MLTTKARSTAVPNADLWRELWAILDRGQVSLKLRWVKGHAETPAVYSSYNVQIWELFGNLCADALADRAAEMCQVWSHDAAGVLFYYSLVKRIQARAVVIMLHTLAARTPFPKNGRNTNVRLRPLAFSGQILASRHKFHVVAKALHCYVCHQKSPSDPRRRAEWLLSPCVPDSQMAKTFFAGAVRPTPLPPNRSVYVGNLTTHSTHCLQLYKELYFCKTCGYHGFHKLQKLAAPCAPTNMEAAIRRVLHLKQGRLPSNMTAWPNELANTSLVALA